MQAATKKHHIEISLTGPAKNKAKAVELLKPLGFLETDTVPWESVFSDIAEDKEAGAALAGARYKEGFTQKKLSELTGILQNHISEMENGKRPIGKKNAKLLAKALHVSYKVFL